MSQAQTQELCDVHFCSPTPKDQCAYCISAEAAGRAKRLYRHRESELLLDWQEPRETGGRESTWNPYHTPDLEGSVGEDAGFVHIAGAFSYWHLYRLLRHCPYLHTIEVAPSQRGQAEANLDWLKRRNVKVLLGRKKGPQ